MSKIKKLLPENLEQENEQPDPVYDMELLEKDPGYLAWLDKIENKSKEVPF